MTNLMSKQTVGELVVEKPSRSRVFERFGIDYCCGGKKPLVQACAAVGRSLDRVLAALEEADAATLEASDVDWSRESPTALVENILTTHHAYLRREFPRLTQMANKVVQAHGERRPEVVACRSVFFQLRAELESHMRKEEMILFPMIRELEKAEGALEFHCGTIQNPISVMEHEHDDAGRALARMRELTNDFTPPADACNTHRAWIDGLRDLETDLHEHIHKENNILFPKAAALEARRTKN